jgi:site-specific DNA recombinase
LTAGDGGQVHEALDKAAAIRARLDLAADSYADGNIDARQLTRITGKLRPELAQWEHAARAAGTTPDLLDLATPDIARRWEDVPLARKRAVIDLLLAIQVDRTVRRGGDTRFDPESVRITWKRS